MARKLRWLLLPFVSSLTFAITNPYRPEWTPQDPCPEKINAVIPVGSPFNNHEAVHEAMKTCTNITELSIYTGFFGCTGFPDRYSLPFAVDGSDRYLSTPQILKLDNYEFDDAEWKSLLPPRPHWSNDDGSWPSSSSSSASITMAVELYYHTRWFLDRLSYPLIGLLRYEWWSWWKSGKAAKCTDQKDNMDLWLEAMDFSHVHTLSIKEHGHPKPKGDALLRRLPLALTSLRSLTIGGRWEADPLPGRDLKSLRLPRALDFIMAFPASSLTNLTWIESGTVDADVFDATSCKNLGKWAPELVDLTIDLDREEENWPTEKLKILGQSLPKLKNLTIYLNLEAVNGKNETMQPVPHYDFPFAPHSLSKPLLDANRARDMFLLLQESQPGDELETVLFREGDWDGQDDLAIRSYDLWSEGLRNWVRCTILGQDGDRLKDGPRCYAEYNFEYKRFKEGRQGELLY
ncbi:hypothetical protein CEP52_006596 [Fusarium oligoseptatum]|uniref:Uncharacterized protein n=1 Tax=Fusarium oligoseptatum TaxID=2604345 RepID=A0A428TS90_9HYPO|nr:hypothetical protein CEP52_006596 [Fusarium oligoseptatum]